MGLRTTAFDFQVFSDPALGADRGADAGKPTFDLETFQESQYGVDEFWRWGQSVTSIDMPDASGNDPLRCPSVRGVLTLTTNAACSDGAVGPPEHVSYGFNMRLRRAEVIDSRGRPKAVAVRVNHRVLEHGQVPLAMDVSGEAAAEKGVGALYTAPPLDSLGPYAADQYWHPGVRHAGKMNIAAIDGHVEAGAGPESTPGLRWEYQPTP
jgi:prepilin-type processing-associated H-X9-DG protein